MSRQELELVKSILARMEAQGQSLSPSTSLLPTTSAGAMTDGSKRLRGNSPSDDDDECDGASSFTMLTSAHLLSSPDRNQAPHVPKFKTKIELPPGVESLEQWGKTICTLPKVKKEAPTFNEIATKEYYEEYRIWVLQNGTTKGPVCLDLYNYLRACGCPGVQEGDLIPGSNTVRKYRD